MCDSYGNGAQLWWVAEVLGGREREREAETSDPFEPLSNPHFCLYFFFFFFLPFLRRRRKRRRKRGKNWGRSCPDEEGEEEKRGKREGRKERRNSLFFVPPTFSLAGGFADIGRGEKEENEKDGK